MRPSPRNRFRHAARLFDGLPKGGKWGKRAGTTKRPANIARPRQIAMYLARELTRSSLKDIGGAFGGKDHGTVIHACKSVAAKMQEDDFRRTVNGLMDKIKKN